MDCDSWKSLVYSAYWDSVTSHVLEEDGATVFICTKDGAFIEFHKGVIQRSCQTNCCSVKSVELFFTYHPYKRYFLLRDLDKLTIITGSKELKIVQVHNGVNKYKIGDFSEEGKPQIKVWPSDGSKEPFILNFSARPENINTTTTNLSEVFLCSRLQLKLEETKGILAKFIKELEDKRRLRRDTLQRLALTCPPEPCPPSFGLQLFFGDKIGKYFLRDDADMYPLQIGHNWQTTCSDRWLIGLAIKNSSCRIIYNLKVFLNESPMQKVSYSVKRLNSTNISDVFAKLDVKTPEVFPSPVMVWQEERVDSELPPGNGCILICVLPFPEFIWSSKKCISGRLTYSLCALNYVGDVYSQELPQFEITARNILDGSLLSQGLHKQLYYTISIIAMSKMVMLTVTTGMVPSRSVEDLLTSQIGFSHSSRGDNFFVHPGINNAALSGCMVQVDQISEGFEMHLYGRSREILFLLVYCIVEACPSSWSISHGSIKSRDVISHHSSVTLSDCSDALAKEIHCIIYNMAKWKNDDSLHTLSTDVKSYVNFRKEVTALQRKTDVIFSSYELEANKGAHIIYH